MTKGQVSTSSIPGINSFNTEVAYKDTKYPFQVERLSDEIYRLSVADSVIDARVTETAEGALLATFGGETHRIFGMQEPLGLRLVLDGVTILMYVICVCASFLGSLLETVLNHFLIYTGLLFSIPPNFELMSLER